MLHQIRDRCPSPCGVKMAAPHPGVGGGRRRAAIACRFEETESASTSGEGKGPWRVCSLQSMRGLSITLRESAAYQDSS
ncbi:unnamed protein product [Boreogadus saida]